ncbi:MAG: putative rhamnosyl transferase [Helicobacteraceae bacterium]|jgi:hypothetical protein|nr:putative rhamnosyl transferase [Helicobacteraceae bacterium]
MSPTFIHIIFIRFSVPIAYGKTGITIDDSWLKYRLDIFKRITLPSLENQTNQNFYICVFFDARSPQWLIEENEREALRWQRRYFPIYVVSNADVIEKSDTLALNLLKTNDSFIISSRIDSDDAYHKKAIEALQNCFSAQEYRAFTFSKLLCFRDKPKTVISKYRYRNSPFISVIEKAKTPLHISLFDKPHTAYTDATELNEIPYALQYIHGSNVANSVRGYAAHGVNLSDYGLSFVISRSYIAMLWETMRLSIVAKNIYKLKKPTGKRICFISRFFQRLIRRS